MNKPAFRMTDTQDGRYAVEDSEGFVLAGLTRNQARTLRDYLLKQADDIAVLETQVAKSIPTPTTDATEPTGEKPYLPGTEGMGPEMLALLDKLK
jgi:hypothetical protein